MVRFIKTVTLIFVQTFIVIIYNFKITECATISKVTITARTSQYAALAIVATILIQRLART
jgi:hypothetical protein